MTVAARTLFGASVDPSVGTITSVYNGASAKRDQLGGVTTQIFFDSNGAVRSYGPLGGTITDSGLPSKWWTVVTPGIGNTHWVRATYVSGNTVSGGSDAVGSWLPMTVNRQWAVHAAPGADSAAVYTFEIATDSGGGTVVATGNIAFEAQSDT